MLCDAFPTACLWACRRHTGCLASKAALKRKHCAFQYDLKKVLQSIRSSGTTYQDLLRALNVPWIACVKSLLTPGCSSDDIKKRLSAMELLGAVICVEASMEIRCIGIQGLLIWHSPVLFHVVTPSLQTFSIQRTLACVRIEVAAAVPQLPGFPFRVVGDRCPLASGSML
jgi:hypothetical protein